MPITLLSGNLNQYGNNGQYETDPSTWGFDSSVFSFSSTRNADQAYAGIFSQRLVPLVTNIPVFRSLTVGKYTGITGRTYLARVRVRTSTANPVANDACVFTFENPVANFLDAETTRTVANAKDAWVEVEAQWTHGAATAGGEIVLRLLEVTSGNLMSTSGLLYIDDFRIYEFIDSEAVPDPPVAIEEVWFSRNPVTKPMAAPTVGWAALDNYRLHDDVRVEAVADSGTYVSQIKINLTPFSDGNVTFQVREAFRKVLTAVPPASSVNTLVRLTDRIKRFKHYTGEVDGIDEAPVELDLTASSVNLVLLGGLSKFKLPVIDYFSTYLPANKKFLTWAPTTKAVDRQQDDYLNFFVYDEDITTLKLRVKAYFTDGTNATSTRTTLTPVAYRNLYQIPAGPNNTGVALITPAKTVTHYELWLEDQTDTVISEVRTYVLDVYTHPRKRLFMFLNSLGAFEILRFTGSVDESVDVSKEEIVKFLPLTYTQRDGERQATNATSRRQSSHSTGFITGEQAAAWLDYMEDFLLSKQVYEVRGSTLLPVVVAGGTFGLNADQVYERVIRFTAVNAYQEENYTPKDV